MHPGYYIPLRACLPIDENLFPSPPPPPCLEIFVDVLVGQAVNFTCYQIFKTRLSSYLGRDELAPWQHMLLGGISGGIGPCVNNPLDVVKTRLQKQV